MVGSEDVAQEASSKSRSLSRRGRWGIIAALVCVLVLGLAYHRHALADLGKTDFDEVELRRGLLLNKDPASPFSGTLLVRDADVALLGTAIFADTPLEAWLDTDTQGLVLEVSVVAGQLEGEATLYADLRASEMAQELGSGMGFVLAKWFAPRQRVANAHFAQSKLEGRARIWQPARAEIKLHKSVEAEFKANRLHGTLRRYHESGALRSEINFVEGAPKGLQREFYVTSERLREVEVKSGGREIKAYYRNGQLRLHEVSEQGQTISVQSWYPDGSKKSVERYEGGMLVHLSRWYSTGLLAYDGAPGEAASVPPEGTILDYHDNGELRSEHSFVAGVLSGPFHLFYDNGKPWESGHYLQDQFDGEHKKWWKNGTQALAANWKQGQKHGKYQRWYASGKLWEDAEFSEGTPVGPYRKHWKNGSLAHDYQYEQGKLSGPYKTYYDNSQPRLEANYKAGKLHGAYKNWLRDGSVYELATYEMGSKVQSSLEP